MEVKKIMPHMKKPPLCFYFDNNPARLKAWAYSTDRERNEMRLLHFLKKIWMVAYLAPPVEFSATPNLYNRFIVHYANSV